MKNTMMLLVAILLTQSISLAAALPKSDDCFATVVGLAKGLTLSYKGNNQKEAHLLSVELTSATDTREYAVTVKQHLSIDTYQIVLENDSAYKCLLQSVTPVEIGG
jgi:hypothetical protein